MAGSSTAAILRDARLRRALRMRDKDAAASTQMDAAKPHRRSGRREGRGARSGLAETSYAIALTAQGQNGHAVGRSAMSDKGMPAIPRPHENEGVGEHVRTRFHVGPKAAGEIAEPLRRTAPNEENSFLLPDRGLASEPAKRTIRPLT